MTDTTEQQAVTVAQDDREAIGKLAIHLAATASSDEEEHGEWTWRDIAAEAIRYFRSLSLACKSGEGAGEIEHLAQFLHDEGGFGDAMTDRTWPDHADDTGQREGGWVKIVPADVQAHFRDVARRWLGSRIAATPTPPTLSEDLREGVVAWLYERKGCDPVVEKDAHRWTSANGWTETPLCRAALNARGGA